MSGTVPITWQRVKEIVSSGNIHELYRSPEGLKVYRDWKLELQSKNIDMPIYLLIKQLQWVSTDECSLYGTTINDVKLTCTDERLFASPDDIKIITNDFPYYFEPGMSHLVVWTKTPMHPDPSSELGDISDYDKSLIEKYVNKTFVDYLGIPKKDVVWFKNWAALQSVRAIPHVHVILRGVDQEKIDKVVGTSGIPLNETDYKL